MANDTEEYQELTPLEAELDGALRALGSPFREREDWEKIRMGGAIDDIDPATPNPRSFPRGKRRLEAVFTQSEYQFNADESLLFRRRALHGGLALDYNMLFQGSDPPVAPVRDAIDTIIREGRYNSEGVRLIMSLVISQGRICIKVTCLMGRQKDSLV